MQRLQQQRILINRPKEPIQTRHWHTLLCIINKKLNRALSAEELHRPKHTLQLLQLIIINSFSHLAFTPQNFFLTFFHTTTPQLLATWDYLWFKWREFRFFSDKILSSFFSHRRKRKNILFPITYRLAKWGYTYFDLKYSRSMKTYFNKSWKGRSNSTIWRVDPLPPPPRSLLLSVNGGQYGCIPFPFISTLNGSSAEPAQDSLHFLPVFRDIQ